MAEEKKGLFDSLKGIFMQEEENDGADEAFEATENNDTVKAASKAVKKDAGSAKIEDAKSLNIKIIKPGDDKSNITTILDSLKNNQVVMVNFENTRPEIRASFADAFFGATYVLGANYTKLSESSYILAPKNVAVSPLITEAVSSEPETNTNTRSYFGSC
ncbi:MAG: cell division protein SepF [Ruminococcaceae bacterium]|nr:cell division protein SepF [Oscillospiraceae bacterium]